MVQEAEARLGVRPRRRTELVQQRLRTLEQRLAQRRCWLDAQLGKQAKYTTQLETLPQEMADLQVEVALLEATYHAQGQDERPHSRLAKARRRLATARKKLAKAAKALKRAQEVAATHRMYLERWQAQQTALAEYLAQLEADNTSNPDPVTTIVRMDAGFGTGPNLAWLIEMGYIIYTKAGNGQVVSKLKARVTANTRWACVGKNAEMTAWGEQHISSCPYPLTVALERFHTPEGLKHSALIVYRDDDQMLTLPTWFDFYNARQTIEAGIKETNVVFKMHPLNLRSAGGIALQEQFALFAANFVRWAAVWLREQVSCSHRRFDDTLTRVKTMVRVAANTSAWVASEAEGLLVRFDETGAYPGVELRLAGTWRARPPLLPPEKVQDSDFKDELAVGCT